MAARPQDGVSPFGADTGYPQQLMAVSTLYLHRSSVQMDLRPAQLRIDFQWQTAIRGEGQVEQRKAVIAQEERRLVQAGVGPRVVLGGRFHLWITHPAESGKV